MWNLNRLFTSKPEWKVEQQNLASELGLEIMVLPSAARHQQMEPHRTPPVLFKAKTGVANRCGGDVPL
jgi:hypothetical protein